MLLRCPMDNRALHHKKKIIHKNFVEILNDVSQVILKQTQLIAATLKEKDDENKSASHSACRLTPLRQHGVLKTA